MFAALEKVRDGTMSRVTFRRRIETDPSKDPMRLCCRGYCNTLTYGFCQELVEHKDNLWTFVDDDRIEPTNNAAEQALRYAVIWRKLSFRHAIGCGEPVRRTSADRHRNLPPPTPQHLRLAHRNGSRSSNRPYHAFFVDRGVNDYPRQLPCPGGNGRGPSTRYTPYPPEKSWDFRKPN